MSKDHRFRRWSVKESDLRGLNPVKARELIIDCFYEAQKETVAKARQKLGLPAGNEDILSSVVQTAKSAFNEVEGDYKKPTVESLTRVVAVLLRKSEAWGTPKEIMEHNKGQVQKVLRRLEQ